MKKIFTTMVLLIVIQSAVMGFTFKATPLPSDSYYRMDWIDEQKYLAEYPEEDREFIQYLSRTYLIPIKFIYRINKIESQMNPNAIRYERNGSHSVGMLQINSVNFDHFEDKFNAGREINYYDRYENLEVGVIYLRWLCERYGGQWLDAFLAFNFGLGRFDRGDEIPKQCIDYAFSIVWGPDYFDCVTTITGAIAGML